MNLILISPAEQLVEIYYKEEWWHKKKMNYEDALKYHQNRLDNGNIVIYEENGEVLGYYERYINGNICHLHNLWIKKEERLGKVFKWLYRKFFNTMPNNITEIIGEKQKIGGKWMKAIIRKGTNHGR